MSEVKSGDASELDEYEEIVLSEAEGTLEELEGYVALDGRGPSSAEREHASRTEAFLRSFLSQIVDPSMAAQVVFDIGVLRGRTLEDPEGALSMCREAFRRYPKALHIARGYRKAVLRAGGSPEEQVVALESEARATSFAEHRAPLELARGRLLERSLENGEAALSAYRKALGVDPTFIPAMTALERLALQGQSTTTAADHAEMIAETVTDPPVRCEHYARAARHLERVDDVEGALIQASKAKVGALTSPAVSFVLERLRSRTGQAQELLALRVSQMAERIIEPAHAWFEVGVLARYKLGDLIQARKAFEFALGLFQGDEGSRLVLLRELAPLLRSTQSWQRLVEVESQRGASEPTPTARAAAWHRAGSVQEKHLGDDESALQCFERALAEDRSFSKALEGAGRIYLKQGSSVRLLAMHELEAESNATLAERAGALRRAGEILIESEERVIEGIEALRLAVELLPGDLATLRVLERALSRREAWEELVNVYEDQLRVCQDVTLRGFLLRQMATIAAERLGDRSRAIIALRELADLKITPPPSHLVTLARLLEEEGELEELVTVLEELVERTEEPDLVASQLERIAEVHERRGDMSAAVEAHRRALEAAPPSHPAVVSAARAFLRAERYEELADLYLRAASDGDGLNQARWLHKAASVMIEQLGRKRRAVDVLRHALAVAPDYIPARLALEELLIEEESWLELGSFVAEGRQDGLTLMRQALLSEAVDDVQTSTDLYTKAADAGISLAELPLLRCLAASGSWGLLFEKYRSHEGSPLDSVHRLYRAAEIAAERLDDSDTAAEILEAILDEAPDTIAAQVALIELGASTQERTRALLSGLMDKTDDSNLRRACLTEIHLSLNGLPQTEEVLAEHLRLVDQGLLDPLVTVALEIGLEERGDRKQLADLLRKLAASPHLDGVLFADIQAHLATLLEELGALQQAADAFEDSLAATSDLPSLAHRIALTRLFGIIGENEKYQASLKQLAFKFPSGPERSTALRLLAIHLSEQHDDGGEGTSSAIAALEDALREDPRDYHSLKMLDELLKEQNDRSRLVNHLMRAFSTEQEPEQIATIGPVLAAQLLRRGRGEQALEVLDRTLAVMPSELESLKLLAEVHRSAGAWAAAAQRLRQIVAHQDAPAFDKIHASRYLASILIFKLNDREAAREVCEALGAIIDDDPHSLAILFYVQELLDDRQAMVGTLEKIVRVGDAGSTLRARALMRLGELQEKHLGDTLSAMKTFAAVDVAKHQLSALNDVLRLSEDTERWDVAAEAIERALVTEESIDPEEEVGLRRRLVGLLEGELERSKDTIPHYERIAELEPADVEVLTRLAELTFAGEPDKAIAHHRALIELQPDRIQSYRALRQLLTRQDDEDALFCVEAVLDGLGLANEEESYFYAQRRSRLSGKLDGSLSSDDWLALCPEHAAPPLAILRAIYPVLNEVFSVDLSSLGLGNTEDPQNLRNIEETVIQASRLFEVPRFRVSLTPESLGPSTLGSEPMTLLIPRQVTECLPREQLFIFGALFGRARIGGVLCDPLHINRITDQQLGHLMWAACELSVDGFETPSERNAIFLDLKERLGKALQDHIPLELREACQGLIDRQQAVDCAQLRLEVNRTAARSGTLASVDPSVAISCLVRRQKMITLEADTEVVHGLSQEAWAGPVFAVSATYQAIRERLSLGVRP